jgi:mannose-6-phosphate isomerase-like protein (cupin superfamily)
VTGVPFKALCEGGLFPFQKPGPGFKKSKAKRTAPMTPKNILKEFDTVTDYWSPKVIGEMNGQYVKIAKLKGEFVWHDHAGEDELFWVMKGQLVLEFRDSEVILNEGEFYVVPKGVEHKPVAEEETWVVLVEPKSTAHTGDVMTDKTKSIEDQLKG